MGGHHFENFNKEFIYNGKTDCPSFLIDYIRYYQWTDEEVVAENIEENAIKRNDICFEIMKMNKPENWVLKWSDNFKGPQIDVFKWRYQESCEGKTKYNFLNENKNI